MLGIPDWGPDGARAGIHATRGVKGSVANEPVCACVNTRTMSRRAVETARSGRPHGGVEFSDVAHASVTGPRQSFDAEMRADPGGRVLSFYRIKETAIARQGSSRRFAPVEADLLQLGMSLFPMDHESHQGPPSAL